MGCGWAFSRALALCRVDHCLRRAVRARHDTIVVGSKNFSEQALLGEILAQHLEARTHLHVSGAFIWPGAYICQQALLAGRIDTYVEYTGTALTAILHDPHREAIRRRYSSACRANTSSGLDWTCCLRSDSTTRLRS